MSMNSDAPPPYFAIRTGGSINPIQDSPNIPLFSTGGSTNSSHLSSAGGSSGKGKIKLGTNKKERQYYDTLANLFAIIQTTEALENLFSSNSITYNDYRQECSLLISQFKTARQLSGLETPESIRNFMTEYQLDCKAAYKRLVEVGIPDGVGSQKTKVVAEAVQHFITVMDSLKLNMSAVDEIQPLMTDLVDSIEKVGVNFNSQKLKNWLITLNSMKASEELSEEQIRQLAMDLETTYNAFHKSLGD